MKISKLTATIFIFLISLTSCREVVNYSVIEGFTQGTTFRIVYSNNINIKEPLDSLVYKLLNDIDVRFSVYNKSSLISGFNNSNIDSIEVDSLFTKVFEASGYYCELSQGLFDISAAPLFDIWGFGSESRDSVTQQKIDSVKVFVGMEKFWIKDGVLYKKDRRGKLNFNAIAQGFTSDYLAENFDSLGIDNYMIEIGGEIRCKGVNSKGELWGVALDKPIEGNNSPGEYVQDVILLTDKGMATSGNYRKFYESGGKIVSHEINPKTGYPERNNLLSATVIASTSMEADALATFFMVAGLEKSLDFLNEHKEIEVYFVYSDSLNLKVYKSNSLKIRE